MLLFREIQHTTYYHLEFTFLSVNTSSCKLRKLGEKIFIFRKLRFKLNLNGEKICIFLILKDTLIHNLKDSEIYHSLNEFVSYPISSTSHFVFK